MIQGPLMLPVFAVETAIVASADRVLPRPGGPAKIILLKREFFAKSAAVASASLMMEEGNGASQSWDKTRVICIIVRSL